MEGPETAAIGRFEGEGIRYRWEEVENGGGTVEEGVSETGVKGGGTYMETRAG